MSKRKKTHKKRHGTQEETLYFVAGCGRKQIGPRDLTELAYDTLEFAECTDCPHRIYPDNAHDFCIWRPTDAPHPFATLQHWASD